MRFECGFHKPTSQLELSDRNELLKTIWLHYSFFVPLAEIQQLRNGLRETLQLELLVALYPDEMHSFFVGSSLFNVTATFLCDSFTIRYSEPGSNKRTLEEAIILNWTDYIMECNGEALSLYTRLFHFRIVLGTLRVGFMPSDYSTFKLRWCIAHCEAVLAPFLS